MATSFGWHQRSCLHCGKPFRFLLIERMLTEGVTHTGMGGCWRIGVTKYTCEGLRKLFEQREAAGLPQEPDVEMEQIMAARREEAASNEVGKEEVEEIDA